MQNRTDIIGISAAERLRQIVRQNVHILRYIGVTFTSAMLSLSYILGGISPFGVAFVASVGPSYLLVAVFGSMVGYIWSPVMDTNMQYIIAVLLIGMIKWFVASGEIWRRNILSAPILAFGTLLLSSMAITFASGFTVYGGVLSLAQALLCGGSSYFFVRSRTALGQKLSTADRSDIACLFVSFTIGVISLSHLSVLGLSVGRVVAVVAVLCAAYVGGEGVGALVGVGAGATALLMGKELSFLMACYSLGGALGGVFSRGGRVATAIAYMVTAALAGVTSPTSFMMHNAILEGMVSCVIFLALPQSAFARLYISRQVPDENVRAERGMLVKKIHRVADGLRDIGDTTKLVSQKLSEMESVSHTDIYSALASGVCKKCRGAYRCWHTDYEGTMDSLNRCMSVLKKEGRIVPEQVPEHFLSECRRPDEVVSALNSEYARYLGSLSTRHKVSQVRSVVSDQFEGLAMLMEGLSEEWDSIRMRDSKLEEKLLDMLTVQGLEPSYTLCYTDENDRMTMQAEINEMKLPRIDAVRLALDAGELAGRDIELPGYYSVGGRTVVTMLEKANLSVEFGAAQIVEAGSKITGDFYQYFNDSRGNSVVILSDGMGSGGNAAVDSAMTTGLIRRLIEAGVGYDAALKMVNSALLVKSGEETLATVDIASVDLYTGRASFYKAGAAPTFVVKKGKVGYIQSTSLPVGILEGVAFEKSSITLYEGDRIVSVSDGVTATGVDWIESQLISGAKMSTQELADYVAKTAKARHVQGRDDDITVIVAEIKKGV